MASEATGNVGPSNTANSLPGSLGRGYRTKRGFESDDDISSVAHSLGRAKSDRNISSGKLEEDRRRRTIIVEKSNNSYGFTLQTYGIHYKKEQEVEMITYVDYVEYDGPAYKAGMREGDVILSINGVDMEKADHKSLVNHIKGCDTRMRMVVLFEDCVRKVSLHMRYIHLQNKLQDKIQELERVCLQERQLLSGKWKTHSLPARKKISGNSTIDILESNITNEMGALAMGNLQSKMIYRPAISTENIVGQAARIQQIHQQKVVIPPPDQYIVAYQYLDPNYRYMLKPSTSNSSGEYFISVGPQKSPSECHYILTRDGSTEMIHQRQQQQQQHVQPQPQIQPVQVTQQPVQITQPCCDFEEKRQKQHSLLQEERLSRKSGTQKTHCHGHSCNPCVGSFKKKPHEPTGEDNTSLDAYDLAGSPCCAAHCVPTRRRSHKPKEHHHHHHHKHKHRDKERQQRPRSQSHASPDHHHHHHQFTNQQKENPQHHYVQHQSNVHPQGPKSKYFNLSSNLASHCSLHSCTSSEFAPVESSASYTTSLSTDTLYWDPQSEGSNSRQPSTKSRQSIYQSAQNSQAGSISSTKGQQLVQKGFPQQNIYHTQRFCMHPAQVQQFQQNTIYQTPVCVVKPKSWDNLTTKVFGGYGFGYGYLDGVGRKPQMKVQIENFTNGPEPSGSQQRDSMPRKNHYGRYSTYADVENYAPPPSQFVEELTTLTVFVKKTEQTVTEQTVPVTSTPQILNRNNNSNPNLSTDKIKSSSSSENRK